MNKVEEKRYFREDKSHKIKALKNQAERVCQLEKIRQRSNSTLQKVSLSLGKNFKPYKGLQSASNLIQYKYLQTKFRPLHFSPRKEASQYKASSQSRRKPFIYLDSADQKKKKNINNGQLQDKILKQTEAQYFLKGKAIKMIQMKLGKIIRQIKAEPFAAIKHSQGKQRVLMSEGQFIGIQILNLAANRLSNLYKSEVIGLLKAPFVAKTLMRQEVREMGLAVLALQRRRLLKGLKRAARSMLLD